MSRSLPFYLKLLLCLVLGKVTGCAGYRFRNVENPLGQYNIKTLSIPMFFNKSSLPNVAGPLTKEFSLLMAQYPLLKVYPGQGTKTDAVLLGIVESAPNYKNVVRESGGQGISGDPGANPRYLGAAGRKTFYVSNHTTVNLQLRVILIKDPTHLEVEVFLSSLGQYLYKNPKIIFNEVLPLTAAFGREVNDTTTVDAAGVVKRDMDLGGVVNFTKNKGTLEKQVQDMAKGAANNFREMILYAF